MSVTDFECAIARSQINRYVAGDTLGKDLIQQLEAHLGMCAKCKRVLEEKKSSLMAMLATPETVEQRPLSLPEEPVAMSTTQRPALPPETLETKQLLRQQLENRQREVANQISNETVAAFAYHDPQPALSATPKKRGLLSAFALFKQVEDPSEDAPKLTRESLTAAKQQLKQQKGGFTKPALYMAGLVAVAGAMAFFLKDPTSLFGAKATTPTALVRKSDTPAAKPVKKVRRSPVKSTASEKWREVRAPKTGTAAQYFVNKSPQKATTPVVKPEAKAPSAIAKPTKLVGKPTARKKPKAQTFATPTVKSTTRSTPKTAPRKNTKHTSTTNHISRPKSAPKPKVEPIKDEGTIKIYDPEGDR